MNQEPTLQSSRLPLVVGIVLSIIAIAALVGAFRSETVPATFDFNRAEFTRTWNGAAIEIGAAVLVIGETTWTDREAGVFGFAFSESMSVLARVESSQLSNVQEIAVVGEPRLDGVATVIKAMDLVINVAEPGLDEAEQRQLLTDLGVLGTDPLDPDRRVAVGTTEFRVAVDAFGGVLGISATAGGNR